MTKFNRQSGSILLAIILMMPFIILIASIYMQLTVASLKIAKTDQFRTYAQLAADAGADYALEQLNLADTWGGTVGEIPLHDDGKVITRFQVTVNPVDDTHKSVVSVGRTYKSSTPTVVESSVSIDVGVRSIVSGAASVVSGVGGLTMKNSAKVLGGSVYINGTLDMTNSSQIGLSILPIDVKVAHQSCPNPADATYPRVCAPSENGEPITLNLTSHIYGSVEATNQTDGSSMTNTGLVAASIAPPVPLPDYDRDAQKSASILPAISGSSAGCNSGTKTWAANTKIDGDVEISNTCKVTVEGNVWITGNFEIRNSGELIVKNGLTDQPVIMIDGSDGLDLNNSAVLKSNTNITPIGFRIITYHSAASCSPNCATVTGVDLFNSQNMPTIDINQSASGPNTEFYARWTKVTAGNNGDIGALAGQTVALENSFAVTFGTDITGFGTVAWIIDSYRRVF